jgi:magnesium transporter
MGEPMTRVYRKGILEAAGFPVADVSEYLSDPVTVVWVDLSLTPVRDREHPA